MAYSLLLVSFLTGCNNAASSNSTSAVTSSASVSVSSSASNSVSSLTSLASSSTVEEMEKKTLTIEAVTSANKETGDFYFKKGDNEIPYITIADCAKYISGMEGYINENGSVTREGQILTMTLPNKETAVFDFASKTITVAQPDKFFCRKGYTTDLSTARAANGFDVSGNPIYIKEDEPSYFLKSKAQVFYLGGYGIPMVLDGEQGYIPLQTFSDLLANKLHFVFFYNGQTVYIHLGSIDLLKEDYYSASTGTRSRNLIDFTYKELCLNFDSNYGLKPQQGISSFDDFFLRTGRKESLMSADPKVFDDALNYILSNDLDDGHSHGVASSYLAGSSYDMFNAKFKGVSNAAYDKEMERFSTARTAALGTYVPYQEIGDTAYLTFDEFKVEQRDYYASAPTLEDAGNDTMALVGYAHKQILANSAIKNVVVDLSCNGGGEATACAYIASWLVGAATISVKDQNTEGESTISYYADVNYDGKFNADDTLDGRGLHIFCLTSLCSFSCGNLLPSLLKSSHRVSLIGQRTGGGACVVQNTSAADGTLFRISGSLMLCTSINGTLSSIDSGVEPDYYLQSASSFYNRTALNSYIDTLL